MDKLKQRIATSALHDTSTRQDDDTSECHPKTRQHLLAQLIDKPAFIKSLIHWFYGPAGAGKTSIMRSLAKALERRSRHLASFYFWRSDGTRNSLRAFVATIAFQIGQQIKPIVPYIEQVLADDGLLLDKSNLTQLEKLVIEPLLALQTSNPTADYPRYLVIDGLDECNEEGQLEFLQTLLPALLTRLSALRLTVYISSRPETLIESEFNTPVLRDISNRIFLEPSPEDVRAFLIAEFEKVNLRNPKLKEKYGGRWPEDEDLDALCDKSSGYFILSKVAMRHINPPILRGRPPDQRLRDILEALMAAPYRPLDALYLHLLNQHAPQNPADLAEWKKIIGLVCIPLYRRFEDWKRYVGGDNVFLQIYGKSRSDLEDALGPLQSLIHNEPISGEPKNYHASFPDFVFNLERSGDFYVDPGLLHEHLVCTLVRSINSNGDDFRDRLLQDRQIFFYCSLRHHSGLARFTDEAEKAAGEISWDAVCLGISDVWGLISKLALIASTVEALENLFSLPDFPRRDEHLGKLASNVGSRLSGRMDTITSSDIAISGNRRQIHVASIVLLPLMSEATWVNDRDPGTPDPLLQHSCVQCLRHDVFSSGRVTSTCSSAARNCHDRTPFFTKKSDSFALDSQCGVFFRLRPPVRITGLLSAFLDSPCFPLICTDYLACIVLLVIEPQISKLRQLLLQYLPHCAPGQDLLDIIWKLCNHPKSGNFPVGSTFLVQWKPSLALPLLQMNGTEVCGYYILRYFNQCKAAGMTPNRPGAWNDDVRALWEESSSLVPAAETDLSTAPFAPPSSLQHKPIRQHNEVSTISLGTTSTGVPSDSEGEATKGKDKKKKPGLLQRFRVPLISSKSGSSSLAQAQKP